MTEEEWLACADPRPMLPVVSGERKLRLFGCAACRRIWDLMTDPRSREAVDASERFADGLISEYELDQLSGAAEEAFEDVETEPDVRWNREMDVAHAASFSSSPSLAVSVLASAIDAVAAARSDPPGAERAAQAALLRDIFGNPFRPVAFAPEWRTDTAVAIARQMYESRDFGAMPILADALQDAGCDNEAVLSHCRADAAPHVRGCWVVDLVLGKS